MPKTIKFIYPHAQAPELIKLNDHVKLEFNDATSQLVKAQQIITYCHSLFAHNGDNEPSSFDPVTIINEAKRGSSFRCVEYSFLAVCILLANDVKARTIGLKTKDVETKNYGAGHVVIEFWDDDVKKWIMSDVQAGVLAKDKNILLSALELKQTLKTAEFIDVNKLLPFASEKKYDGGDYGSWLKKYLYYIDSPLAMKLAYSGEDSKKEQRVMLVPNGANKPKLFQNMFKMNLVYTFDSEIFYQPPT